MREELESTIIDRFGDIRADYEDLREILKEETDKPYEFYQLQSALETDQGTISPAEELNSNYDEATVTYEAAGAYWRASTKLRNILLEKFLKEHVVDKPAFCELGELRQHYKEYTESLIGKDKLGHIALLTDKGLVYVKDIDITPINNNALVFPQSRQEYWEAAVRANKSDIEEDDGIPDSSPDEAYPAINKPLWSLRFFQECPTKTAAALLVTYESVSIGVSAAINKDLLINMPSNSTLTVYLSPVAAVILTCIAATVACKLLKKDQDLDSQAYQL